MSLYGRDDSKILGFDPSTTSTGWALLRASDQEILRYGRIRPDKKLDIKERTLVLGRESQQLIRTIVPDVILIEEPDDQGIVGRTTGTQARLAACSYLIAGGALADGYTTILIPVQQWKGNVPKDVIYRRLRDIYGAKLPHGTIKHPENHDAIDAIGLIRAWIANPVR